MTAGAEANSPEQRPPTRGDWLLLFVLAAMQFTHVVDFMILMPLGPRYMQEMHIGPDKFGFLVSAYAFSAAVAGVLASIFIDRFDRKRAMLVLYAGFTIGTLFCGIAPDYYTLLIARAITGGFGGITGAVVLAIVGDVFPENRRGLATGVIMSSFSLATIAGVPAGLVIAEWYGTSAPFLRLGLVSVGMWLLGWLVLPSMRRHLQAHKRELLSPIGVLLDPPHVRAYLLMTALVCTTFTIIPYISAYLVCNAEWKSADLWMVYVAGGAATLVSMPVFGRLADRVGKLRMFRILALLNMVPLILLTTLGPSSLVWGLTVTTLFFVFTSGRMVPAMAMITSSSRPAYRGSFMSLNASVQQLASGLAAVVGGLILTRGNENGPIEGFPYAGILGCVLSVVCMVLAGYVRPVNEQLPSPVSDHAKTNEAIAHFRVVGEAASTATVGSATLPAATPQNAAIQVAPLWSERIDE